MIERNSEFRAAITTSAALPLVIACHDDLPASVLKANSRNELPLKHVSTS
jgi:hypothetical protein